MSNNQNTIIAERIWELMNEAYPDMETNLKEKLSDLSFNQCEESSFNEVEEIKEWIEDLFKFDPKNKNKTHIELQKMYQNIIKGV